MQPSLTSYEKRYLGRKKVSPNMRRFLTGAAVATGIIAAGILLVQTAQAHEKSREIYHEIRYETLHSECESIVREYDF
jgi:hypothetical protein